MLCKWLSVSRSGYYAWLERDISMRTLNDHYVLQNITAIYEGSEGRYGSPRVFKALISQGIQVGRKRVERLMREANLRGRVSLVTRRQPGLKRFVTKGSNLLLEHGNATALNQVWVTDVTYLKVKGRWQYLATVMDQCSRRILGWSLAETRTTKLSTDALMYALKKRNYPKGIIIHSDRGWEFQSMLHKYELNHSVNRPGHCTDNAFMESFYHSLKAELIRGTVFSGVKNLRCSISRYINQFYNAVRLHSGLNYVSPMQYEQRFV